MPLAVVALLQGGSAQDVIGTGAGIGGLGLAGAIFYFYRQERANSQSLTQRAFDVIEANTAAVTKVAAALDALVANCDRHIDGGAAGQQPPQWRR